MIKTILVINAGSATIKFSLYQDDLSLIYKGIIKIKALSAEFKIYDHKNILTIQKTIATNDYEKLFKQIFIWMNGLDEAYILSAIGHRVVHGGLFFKQATIINAEVLTKIESLIPLAPLHQGHNINAIKIINNLYPELAQIACFDTAFHHQQNYLAKLYALPQNLTTSGIIRYGFHGLSYEYIVSQIKNQIGAVNKVIVAHLGSGASMCALDHGTSVASSMGFSALDGLMMGTRCGNIDPGIILYLLNERNYSPSQISNLLYQQSGLLGVSGLSADMEELLLNDQPSAIEAIELFCYRAALELGSLAITLAGVEAIIFTAGIGEHSAVIRKKICAYLIHWGVKLNEMANNNHATIISTIASSIIIGVISTNEEAVIAAKVLSLQTQ